MKRFLSVLLVLATLLTVFPLAVSATETNAVAEETTGLGDYRDLYVKDGLVALFTAYESTASSTAPTSWTPANYYGIKGYDSYLAPSAYTFTGSWVAKNGCYATTAVTSSLSLDALVSAMATAQNQTYPNYSVQEIMSVISAPSVSATYSTDENGDLIIDNYTSLGSNPSGYRSTYGSMGMNYLFYTKLSTPANKTFIHNYLIQIQHTSKSSYGYKANANLTNAYYGGQSGVYYYMADGVKTVLNNGTSVYAGTYPSSVWEQTVSRTLNTASTTEENVVFAHKVSMQFPCATTITKSGYSFDTTTDATSTVFNTLTVLRGKKANVFALRVYNHDLSDAEKDRNHFADLCGYYGADVTELLSFSDEQLAYVAGSFASTALYKEKYKADGTTLTDAYQAAKADFETKLASAVKIAKAAFKAPDTYELLYVKDGLVALFNAYSSVSEMGTVTSWMPANLYGKEGYDSYLNPTAYALTGSWTAKDGAYQSASGAYFTLSSLIDAMAEAADEVYPTYTVQEVFNFTSSPTGTNASYVKDESGDWIFNNYSDAGLARKDQVSTYGSFRMAYLFYPKCHTPSGVTFIHNYLLQLQTYNGSFGYYRNFNTNTDYYAQKGIYYYMADGVKTALNSGKQTYAGIYPSAVWEQTAWRTLDETSTDEENIVIDGKVSWQFGMGSINSGSYSGRGFQFTTTDPVDACPDNNALTILNAGNIQVYSVRVYNKTFTEAEMNRNHLADLCAFYEVDVTALLAMKDEAIAVIASQMASIPLYREKYNASGVLTDGYKSAKLAFETQLAAAIGATLADGETTYIDLYVKEGLVALFDAYGAAASDEAPTAWTPVDLYGKEGYDAYLEPVAYPLYDNTDHLAWKWENGRLTSYRQSAAGAANVASGFYFNLDTLGATVGKTYTVQEIFQITDFNIVRPAPTVEIDADGSYIITNYTSFSGKSNETSATYYGPLQYNTLAYHKYSGSNDPLISSHFGQVIYYNSSNEKKSSNTFFNTAHYFTDPTRRTYYYIEADTSAKTSIGKASLGDMTWGVTEQTVSRLGAGTYNETSGYTAVQYRFTWQFMPSKYGSSSATARNKVYTTYTGGALSDSTRLRVLGAKVQNAFSVRVYNTDLSSTAIDQNHFADLCGFYGIAANGIASLSETAFIKLIEDHVAFAIEKNAFDADGNYTDAYYTAKLALQTAINNAVLEELYSVEAAQKNLLSFEGHSFRVSGDYGIRAIFSLNKANLARMQDQGITLLNYGAIMAIGTYDGVTYNEHADALTLTASADGKVSLTEGIKGAAFTESQSASFKTLTDDESATRFAYTTTYSVTSAAELFTIDMLYRGFAVFQTEGGETVVEYYDMTESESAKNSLFALHKNVIDYYGHRHTTTLGMDIYDYIYDVLSSVDGETYSDTARAKAKAVAEEYGFDANNIAFSFGALSDVHVVNAARGNRMANMMKVLSNTYNVDAILFAGDITDKLNGPDYATDAGFLAGYKELAFFAEYAAEGNVNNVPLIWTLGNHERPHMTNTNAVTFTSGKNGVTYTIPADTTVTEGFYSVMENATSTFMDPTEGAPTGFRYQDVGGYAFFAVDYTFANNETIKWLDEQLTAMEKAEPNKPIFVTSHMPSTHSAQIDCITECIAKHGNVIYFSGHTHVTMQSGSSITERDGFLELVLGPGSHCNFGVSGSGYSYNSYEMKQGAVIEVDVNGNVRIRCVDMNYDVQEDGSIDILFSKGGNDDLGTIATNPYVLRTAYFSNPTQNDRMHVIYDSVPRYTTDPRYEAPAFESGDSVTVSEISNTSLKLSIPKASATNYIKYYKISVVDSQGNKVALFDKLASTKLTGTSPKATLVNELSIGSEFLFHMPYDLGYPDPFIYVLHTSYTLTTKDANGTVTDTTTYYIFEEGESYTISIVAYDDFGTATNVITGTFTLPTAQ